jgi:hypothetical protein
MTVAQWLGAALFYFFADRIYNVLYPARQSIVICSVDKHEQQCFARSIDEGAAHDQHARDGSARRGRDQALYGAVSTVFVGDISASCGWI